MKFKKDDAGCIAYCLSILVINIVGIIAVRTNETVKGIVETLYAPVFIFGFILALILSSFNWRLKDFFGEVSWHARWCMIFFAPVFIASIIK